MESTGTHYVKNDILFLFKMYIQKCCGKQIRRQRFAFIYFYFGYGTGYGTGTGYSGLSCGQSYGLSAGCFLAIKNPSAFY